jgi:hypothetical protein
LSRYLGDCTFIERRIDTKVNQFEPNPRDEERIKKHFSSCRRGDPYTSCRDAVEVALSHYSFNLVDERHRFSTDFKVEGRIFMTRKIEREESKGPQKHRDPKEPPVKDPPQQPELPIEDPPPVPEPPEKDTEEDEKT